MPQHTLSFSNARNADGGDYTVAVTNPPGSIMSNKATLSLAAIGRPNPASSASSTGGGGSVKGWFVLALLVLGTARFGVKQTFGKRHCA
jgi:hypothetical protein